MDVIVNGYHIKLGANLRDANLRGADLDMSVFPLWCGSFGMKVDDRIIAQLFCHIARLDTSACTLNFTISKKLANAFCAYRGDVTPI